MKNDINPNKSGQIKSFVLAFFCLLTFFAIVIVVGYRDESIGTDTEEYIKIFHMLVQGGDGRYEPGFVAVVRLISFFTVNVKLFFLIVAAIILLGYITLFVNLVDWKSSDRRNADIVLIFGLLMASSWFVTATINGIRQGMALPFAYLSLFLFFQKRYGWSLALMLLSVSFHFSSFALIPFFILAYFKRFWLFFTVLVSALMYSLGFLELIVAFFSKFLGIPVYEFIRNYGVDFGYRVGFQADLFLYSLFWLLFFLMSEQFIHAGNLKRWRTVVSMYAILLMPYFFLGFGGFSNRFGFIAWFFLPAIQGAFILWSKFDLISKCSIGSFWFVLGCLYFFSFFTHFY